MRAGLDPFSFLVTSVAGWMNQRQQQVIEYLVEENRVLREQLGCRRLRFTDSQRRRIAAKAKRLGREGSRSGRHNRDSGDIADMASEADCAEIRRQRPSKARPATDFNGDYKACRSNGRGESRLGLHPDPRSLGESGAYDRANDSLPIF